MPPLPKPSGQRRRTNTGQAQWQQLPVEGRKGTTPPLPKSHTWHPSVKAWWKTIWASPMATAWLDADVDGVLRLAYLKDAFIRGEAPATALPAMQQLEDRFGLSPKARRALQWEVSRAQQDVVPALALLKPRPMNE